MSFPASGPVFIAHRAGNSLRALRRAEAAGADVVEADVFLRRGGIEVRHSKTMGPVPLLWDRWSLERGWGRRWSLEGLLASAASETRLMLDIKRHATGLSETLAEAMAEAWPGREYLVCSQAWRALDPFAERPEATRVYSIGNRAALKLFMARIPPGGKEFCSVHQQFLDAATAEALVARTELVMSWPLNERSRIDQLLAMGVRGFITDRVGLIVAAKAEAGGRGV